MIRQFDVRHVKGSRSVELVVVVQSHLLDGISTVLVAPLLRLPRPAAGGLVVGIRVGDEELALVLSQMAAVPVQALGATVGSAVASEDDIRRGLDRLFTGF